MRRCHRHGVWGSNLLHPPLLQCRLQVWQHQRARPERSSSLASKHETSSPSRREPCTAYLNAAFLSLLQVKPCFSVYSHQNLSCMDEVVPQEAAGAYEAYRQESETESKGGVAYHLSLQLRACYIPTRNSARMFAVQLVPCSHKLSEGFSIRPCTAQPGVSSWSHRQRGGFHHCPRLIFEVSSHRNLLEVGGHTCTRTAVRQGTAPVYAESLSQVYQVR